MNNQKGQILVETMVALGMVTISLMGLLSLLTNSISVNKIISNEYVASYLAGEGIEIIKNILDRNVSEGRGFNEGLDLCQSESGCRVQYNSPDYSIESAAQTKRLKFDDSAKIYQYDSGNDTSFSRTIKISENLGGNEIIVKSNVTWKSRGGIDYNIDLEDHFFNWR